MKSEPFNALGIDVGGTKIAAGVVSFPAAQILFEKVIPTHPERGGDSVLNAVEALAGALAAEAGATKHPVQAVGLGICELVDPNGRILSHNCLPWDGPEVQQRLTAWGPVVLEADVRVAARAEALYGCGQSFRIFLYVTVGTGIASCLMVDGLPYQGARGATGTMASSPISIPCSRCGHVNDRTLEEIASGPALVARYNDRKPGGAQNGPDVFAAAAQGDPDALEVVRSAGESLESMVGLLVNVLDPEAVIVGGGLGLSEGPYWDSFIAATRRHIWSDVHRDLPILRATTGPRAGLIGAAAVAWLRYGS